MSDNLVVCSPSGRYACREKKIGGPAKKRKMLFFDLQEEICHQISLVGVKYHNLDMLYWLDETHLVVYFACVAPENKEPVDMPQRALYEVDLTKKKLQPKKIIYWREDERSFSRQSVTEFSNDFVTVNNHEYFVFAGTWIDHMDAEHKKEFDDLENNEMFTGNKRDYTWFRFIPKGFENEPEIGKIYLNYGEVCRAAGISPEIQSISYIFAHKSKLYTTLYDGILVVDMDKCYSDIKKKSDLIMSSDCCTIVKMKDSLPYEHLSCYQNGLFYLDSRYKDKNNNLYTRIWDIEKNLVTSYFKVDEECVLTDDPNVRNRGFERILHSSGHFIQTDAYAEDMRLIESRIFGRYVEHSPKKCFTFNKMSLKSVRTKAVSLQQLALDHIILNKSRNLEMYPPFIKDGRNLITIPIEK